MSTTTIVVNFGRPMPLFPLHDARLMPHGVARLSIFEPRYRQMVSDALDGPGLIAMAVFAGDEWKQQYHGRPPLRPAVCIGHVAEHFKYPDGRYEIMLQGVCRGRIIEESAPVEGKLYRQAMIEPVGVEDPEDGSLEQYRDRFCGSLAEGPLRDLRVAEAAVNYLKNPEIPTAAVIEFLGARLQEGAADVESRYQWLAAGDTAERARIVSQRLAGLETLLRRAAPQRRIDCPKGCNYN